MATPYGGGVNDMRRGVPSPRPKGRENAKNTLCRNITIYGHCRYEKDGCAYNHDVSKVNAPQTAPESGAKKRFNVDSPSFTPFQPATNGVSPAPRVAAISPKAANAAVFTPKISRPNTATPDSHLRDSASDWGSHDFPEFIPQTLEAEPVQGFEQHDPSGAAQLLGAYDPFGNSSSLAALGGTNVQGSVLPYAQDTAALSNPAFYQGTNTYTQPTQYHLYFPLGPHKQNLSPYQRNAHDFFIPDLLREELQRKAEASLQVLPNSTLPTQIDHFHSLVPLDTNNQRNAALFGYPTWAYKAVSSKDGYTYTLRRLEGYRLTDERAIRAVQPWKRVNNASVVTVHDAFTTRAFGDSSLIFVMDYHPLSKTLAEHHFSFNPKYSAGRSSGNHTPEQVIWGYIVQIASALKTIHNNGLAARVILPSKILMTSKNRVRLNGCAILDLVQFESPRTVAELQQEDLVQFGRLILGIATNNQNLGVTPMQKALDQLSRSYTQTLRECVTWLMTASPNPTPPSQQAFQTPVTSIKDIDTFLTTVAGHITTTFDSTLHAEDTLLSTLSRELENGRLVRLLAKLNFINERPEFDHSPQWSETGERYYLKLFRDYVFHQVDAGGNPVVDLGHVLTCMNKLDAGIDEKINLVSRDEQNCLIVSYRELKRAIESAFQDLLKAGRRT